MKISIRDRKLLIGGAIGAIFIGVTAFLIGRSLGLQEEEGEEGAETTAATVITTAVTNRIATAQGQSGNVVTVPVGPDVTQQPPSDPSATQLPVIVDVSGPTGSMPASSSIGFRAHVQGPAREVGVALKRTGAQYGGGPTILANQGQTGDTALYSGNLGYTLTPGDYIYDVYALATDNKTFVVSAEVKFTIVPT